MLLYNMPKEWKILPNIKEEFVKVFPEISPAILQLLYNRGLTNGQDIDDFFYSDYRQDKFSPFIFSQIEEATASIIKHIKKGDKICVYGDYDADGVTSSALLYEILQIMHAQVDIYIPDRVSEGYGLNKKALEKLADSGNKLIITVDGGIRNKEEVAYAQKLGVEVIITDHHTPPDSPSDYPECIIINPQSHFETYPSKTLAGVGVAYKLAKALIEKSTLPPDDKKRLENQAFDLVAIGTIADCVPLVKENRALVKYGLNMINKTKRIGLIELMKAASLKYGKELDSWNISFQLAPRLNAAGRMDHANTSFELLVTKDKELASKLANRLNESNAERQKISEEIFNQVEAQIKAGLKQNILIGIYQLEDKLQQAVWNEGVIGLVAGKLAEKYYRPALVITTTENGYKGSGRSIEEFNIIKALEQCAPLLEKFGGHPSACGFSLTQENLDDFIRRMQRLADKELKDKNIKPKLKIEASLSLDDINDDLMGYLKLFEPFGEGNQRPKFLIEKIAVADKSTMGTDGRHVKFRLSNGNSRFINAIGFGQAADWQNIRIGDTIDIVSYVDKNEFNGRSETQLRIIDIRKH